MQGVYSGRHVQYVLGNGPRIGAVRPAEIVNVLNGRSGIVNLIVFMDGVDDGRDYELGIARFREVPYSKEMRPGTWHMDDRAVTRVVEGIE